MKKILFMFMITSVIGPSLMSVGPQKESHAFFEYDRNGELAKLRIKYWIKFFGEEYHPDDFAFLNEEPDPNELDDIFARVRKRKQNSKNNNPVQSSQHKKEIQELDEASFEDL